MPAHGASPAACLQFLNEQAQADDLLDRGNLRMAHFLRYKQWMDLVGNHILAPQASLLDHLTGILAGVVQCPAQR